MTVKLYDYASKAFVLVDGGAVSQNALLLAILVELRVQSMILMGQSGANSLEELRTAAAQDPGSLQQV